MCAHDMNFEVCYIYSVGVLRTDFSKFNPNGVKKGNVCIKNRIPWTDEHEIFFNANVKDWHEIFFNTTPE